LKTALTQKLEIFNFQNKETWKLFYCWSI